MTTQRRWGLGIVALGVAVSLSGGWHLLRSPITDHSVLHPVIDAVLVVGAGLGIIYAARWHVNDPLPAERYPRLTGWIAGAGLLTTGLNVITLYIGSEVISPMELGEASHVGLSVGLLVGTLVGTIEAQAIVNAEAAAKADTRARALREERNRLEELDDLLRHYILNGVCIIEGYAGELRPAVEGTEREDALDAITDQATRMVTLVEHIDGLTADATASTATGDVDLGGVLARASVDAARDGRVPVRLPESLATVSGHDALGDGLELLLDALVSITDDDGDIEVTQTRAGDGRVTLHVAVTGASLPAAIREALFEPIGTGTGLQFYLAGELIERSADIRLHEGAVDRLLLSLTFREPRSDVVVRTG